MDIREKIKGIDINSFATNIVVAIGSISVSGAVQFGYFVLTCISFFLTYKMTTAKHRQIVREKELQNKLLELEIEAKGKNINDEET